MSSKQINRVTIRPQNNGFAQILIISSLSGFECVIAGSLVSVHGDDGGSEFEVVFVSPSSSSSVPTDTLIVVVWKDPMDGNVAIFETPLVISTLFPSVSAIVKMCVFKVKFLLSTEHMLYVCRSAAYTAIME